MRIVITGLAGAGKDTIAVYLCEQHGFTKIALADPMKDEVSVAFDLSKTYLNERSSKEIPSNMLALDRCEDRNYIKVALGCFEKEDERLISHMAGRLGEAGRHYLPNRPFSLQERMLLPRSPRQTMQVWGTDYRRGEEFGHNEYWLDIFAKEFEKISADANVVVTDCRLCTELTKLRSMEFVRFHVDRPALTQSGHTATRPHVTEMPPPIDRQTTVFTNDGTIVRLLDCVDDHMERYFGVNLVAQRSAAAMP